MSPPILYEEVRLFSLRARLQHIGGSIEIDTHPGGPSRVILAVPISKV